jgi:hypothetical protein
LGFLIKLGVIDYRGCIEPEVNPVISDFRENYLNELTQTIENEEFISRSRSKDGGKGFTRQRKIHFAHLIILLVQGLKRSLQRELNSFYQKLQRKDFLLQHVTKGAFSRARAKLKPEAFVELNDVGINNFYKHAPYQQWHGFRLLSSDGSTAVLPNHPSIKKEFGVTKFGPYANSPRSVARISLLYDVLNFTTLDGQIGGYTTSERTLLKQHLDKIKPGTDLLLLDRGYPSYGLLFELQARGIHYCIRLTDDWWLEARKLSGEDKDREVVFQLPKDKKGLRKQYPDASIDIRCRLVFVALPDGSKEVLCTSLLDKEAFPVDCFAELYHFRWNIEEGYKLYKCRMELEAFSGKTALAVKQDFFAGVFMMTTAAVMAFPVVEELKKTKDISSREHPHQINRTNALAMIREMAINLLMRRMVTGALNAFDNILRKTTEIIRPNRKVTRKKLKKKAPAMNYKRL